MPPSGPSLPRQLFRQALASLRSGDLASADQACRRILDINGREPSALALMGQIATMGSRHEEALRFLKRAVTAAPKEPDYHAMLAEALANQARYRQALARYDRALRLRLDHPAALAGKANVYTRLGDWHRARALLEPLVREGREDAGAAVVYARVVRRDGDCDRAAEIARRHLDDSEMSEEVRRTLWFEIGASREAAGRHEQAFKAYEQGNGIAAGAWNSDASAELHHRIAAVFTRETIERLPRPSASTALPVFIVGMPRSGSTLIEQIIDAHPRAAGAGELAALPDLCNAMGERIGSTEVYPQCALDLESGDVDELAAAYLSELRRHAPRGAERICDKELSNYLHAGLITALLPQARIVHSRRDPLDTCVSCFAQRFAPGVHQYSTDLRLLGAAYNQYQALMGHWRDAGVPMLEVQYEELVADQEAVSRRIIDFCGLPWDERCLRFHESGREVITLSREQVRRPIYSSAVGRHRHYERWLGPLRQVLEQGGA